MTSLALTWNSPRFYFKLAPDLWRFKIFMQINLLKNPKPLDNISSHLWSSTTINTKFLIHIHSTMDSHSFCNALSFTDLAINRGFWCHSSYGQNTSLPKDHGFCDSNNRTETQRFPLIQWPYVSASCLSRKRCTFPWIAHILPFFSWLGKYDFRQPPWGIHCHSLVAVCLLINLSGRFLFNSREEMLIHTAHVSILWWRWSVELQKMFKILVVLGLFKVAKD